MKIELSEREKENIGMLAVFLICVLGFLYLGLLMKNGVKAKNESQQVALQGGFDSEVTEIWQGLRPELIPYSLANFRQKYLEGLDEKVRAAAGDLEDILSPGLIYSYRHLKQSAANMRTAGDLLWKADGVLADFKAQHASSLLTLSDVWECGRLIADEDALEKVYEEIRSEYSSEAALFNFDFLAKFRLPLPDYPSEASDH